MKTNHIVKIGKKGIAFFIGVYEITILLANTAKTLPRAWFYRRQISEQLYIGEAGQSIREFVRDSQKTITAINQVVEKLNQGQGSAGEFLNNKKYVESLNDVLNEFKTLLQDIKKKPKRYFRFTIF